MPRSNRQDAEMQLISGGERKNAGVGGKPARHPAFFAAALLLSPLFHSVCLVVRGVCLLAARSDATCIYKHTPRSQTE